jgi:hypothetical protein
MRVRTRSERGSALAEFAIAFPLLIVIMLAVIDFGLEYGNKVAVADSARRASRVASVARVGSDSSCSVNGSAPDPQTHKLVCLAKRRTRMSDDRVAVKVLYMGANGKQTTNFSAAKMTENKYSVVVCVSASARSISGLLRPVFDGRFHHSRSVTKTAKPFTGTFPPPWEETPLTSGSVTDTWSWCEADDPVGTE